MAGSASLGLALLLPAAQAPAAEPAPEAVTLSHGQFGDVRLFRPRGAVQEFVLLLSEGDALSAGERQLATTMAATGALVAGVAWPPFYRGVEARGATCVNAVGDLDNLARYVQAYEKLPTYITPVLAGSGSGASFAYSLFAQAPSGIFTSALTLGFCPKLAVKAPPCAVNAMRWRAAADGNGFELQTPAALTGPWIAVQSPSSTCAGVDAQAFIAAVPQATWIPSMQAPSASAAPVGGTDATAVPTEFKAGYARLASQRVSLGAPPTQLADLPVVEVPSTASADKAGKRFAVMVSGDGGWAGIDKGIGAALAKEGVPVVGLDSLRYFWSARTPQGLATDLDRLIRFYAARWKKSEVILIGYSQGADVLPFAVNRLPERTRNGVKLVALLGPGQKASFEFHLSNWIGPSGDKPIAPEALKLLAAGTLCIYGAGEKDSLCPELAPQSARVQMLTGGHHFGGDYDGLATRILEAAPR
jgi:type IV secretory pathway VirJ component